LKEFVSRAGAQSRQLLGLAPYSLSKAHAAVKGNGSRKEKNLMNGIAALQERKCLKKHIAFLTMFYRFTSESFRGSFCLQKPHRKKLPSFLRVKKNGHF